MSRPLVLFHARCADGMTAAWVTHRYLSRLQLQPELVPMDYGGPSPTLQDVARRDVFLVDFCLPADPLKAMASAARSVTVLDHHTDTAAVADATRGTEDLHVHYDPKHSGGFLCWRHFFADLTPPNLVRYTEDYDLWVKALPFTHEVNAYIGTRPWTLDEYEGLYRLLDREIVADFWPVAHGRTILAFQEKTIEDHDRRAFETDLDGHRVLAVNCTEQSVHSELTGRLSRGRAFGLSWFVRADGTAQVSVRVRDGAFNAAELARRYGGGGHVKAAGFQVPPGAPLPFPLPAATPKGGVM